MRIFTKTQLGGRDFQATFVCNLCGQTKEGSGYEDDYFYLAMSKWKCGSCGKDQKEVDTLIQERAAAESDDAMRLKTLLRAAQEANDNVERLIAEFLTRWGLDYEKTGYGSVYVLLPGQRRVAITTCLGEFQPINLVVPSDSGVDRGVINSLKKHYLSGGRYWIVEVSDNSQEDSNNWSELGQLLIHLQRHYSSKESM